MQYILNWLDRTTMYRVVLYVLSALALYAFLLSFTGLLYSTPTDLVVSMLLLLAGGLGTHYALKVATGAPANVESSLISLLILFLIIEPLTKFTPVSMVGFAFVAVIAIGSKYAIAWRRLHLFNPVALSAIASTALAIGYDTWWVGNPYFFPFVLLGGLMIAQKIRRVELALLTIGSALLFETLATVAQGTFQIANIHQFFLSTPIVFFATVMVTEPLTTPAGKFRQRWYALTIGLLLTFDTVMPFSIGPVAFSYSAVLITANLLFYFTTLRARIMLTLHHVEVIAQDTLAFHFEPALPFHFKPGQYLEWTVPHSADARGIRRYFTIASAPGEKHVTVAMKVPKDASTFKKAMHKLRPGDTIHATALHGDFVLPPKADAQPIVMIAGGIGVTPFRSHVRHLVDTKTKTDTTLFYCVRSRADIAWKELWHEAEEYGVETVPVVSEATKDWKGERGELTPEIVARYVKKPAAARYYISGPAPMVNAYTAMLKEMGVPKRSIVTDYFPGLA